MKTKELRCLPDCEDENCKWCELLRAGRDYGTDCATARDYGEVARAWKRVDDLIHHLRRVAQDHETNL